MNERAVILCVDDEPGILSAISRTFLDQNYRILTAQNPEEGLQVLRKDGPVQVVISDFRMPGMNGVEFLRQVRAAWPDTVRMILSGFADVDAILAAVNEGQIYKFILKPWNPDDLRLTVINALERYALGRKNRELGEDLARKSEELRKLNETMRCLIEEKSSETAFQRTLSGEYQAIFESLPAAVLCMTGDGLIRRTTTAAERFFAFRGSGLAGALRRAALAEDWNVFIDSIASDGVSRAVLSGPDREVVAVDARLRHREYGEGTVLLFDAEKRPAD